MFAIISTIYCIKILAQYFVLLSPIKKPRGGFDARPACLRLDCDIEDCDHHTDGEQPPAEQSHGERAEIVGVRGYRVKNTPVREYFFVLGVGVASEPDIYCGGASSDV